MLYRTLSLSLAVAVALFVVSAASARPDTKEGAKTHSGKFLNTKGAHQFVMTDKDGKGEHTHTLGADATVTCDGKACKLSDLKEGTMIRVTVEEKDGKKIVTKVEGRTKKDTSR